ncbi:lymphokine-activated killer T-cell-originated protein kinase-like [Strongylocentrotus purpuratus]|uniref:Protein kinase domain-containing protein n=1 Tax=Strongylocentrotus purpuratus TaxID=7668 RepID=A0A7M7NK26_STRPU|nr:lymphokine-activated killer T-cell-originated protein kinase-like [Strongylocentrotus purpuratus]|eukprot:XP_798752.1 PREDICTED: lymphokine-activated killer T-cell-originated protein kinase [Strongylocentrotus purpuratus]
MASTEDKATKGSLKNVSSDFLTPVHPAKRSRVSVATPARNSPATKLQIPASPFMKKLGWGTGVSVYLLERSPRPDGSGRSPWAVKKIRSKYKKGRGDVDVEGRLKKEAVILKKMSHANIVEFRALSKSADGSLCLSMENGQQSLMGMIDQRKEAGKGPFPAAQIYQVALSLASALNYLHNDLKYIHGDLKSGNVLVKGDFETVKLCDFGVALKLTDDLNGLENPTDDYVGSQPWNAMEVHMAGDITHKTDMFSYGLVIWEMMSLEAPHLDLLFSGDDSEYDDDETSFDESEFEAALGTRPPLPKENLGPAYQFLIELFCACTIEDPTQRPSAKMTLAALEDVML